MAQPKYTTHLGMVDILPDEVRKWQYLENLIPGGGTQVQF
jgi:histidyl-tRNA synthetase